MLLLAEEKSLDQLRNELNNTGKYTDLLTATINLVNQIIQIHNPNCYIATQEELRQIIIDALDESMDDDSNEYESSFTDKFPTVVRYANAIGKVVADGIDCGVYEQREYDECIEYLTKHVTEVLESCEGNIDKLRCCRLCGLPMLVSSMAYDEGCHFDSCF